MQKVDVVIPFHIKDAKILPFCIESIHKYLIPEANRILLIHSQLPEINDILSTDIHFIDESSFIKGFTKDNIPSIEVNGKERKGWYFQQILKLAASEYVQTDNYLVIDADTIFLKKSVLLDGDKYILRRSPQYNIPYFQTYSKLLGYFPERQFSFITNYMIWNTRIVKEILMRIETQTNMKWYEAIIAVVDREVGSSFSEYETYGYYLSKFYPSIFISAFRQNLELSISQFSHHSLRSFIAKLQGFESITYHNYNIMKDEMETDYNDETGFAVFADYLEKFVKPQEINVALDLGSRDGKISLEMSKRFPAAKVYAFECNPMAIQLCKQNIGINPRIKLVELAATERDGLVDFYPIDPERTITTHKDGNIGASSLFKANPKYPYEKYVQNHIMVQGKRLDNWAKQEGISKIDLIWVDIQGAELMALRGLGDLINEVKAIYTEVEYKEMYIGQPLFEELNKFLKERKFKLVKKFYSDKWFGNVLYLKDGLAPLSWGPLGDVSQ